MAQHNHFDSYLDEHNPINEPQAEPEVMDFNKAMETINDEAVFDSISSKFSAQEIQIDKLRRDKLYFAEKLTEVRNYALAIHELETSPMDLTSDENIKLAQLKKNLNLLLNVIS